MNDFLLAGGGQVCMPGKIEYNDSKKRMAEGIHLEEEVVHSLSNVAAC